MIKGSGTQGIAIVGMAGRFPGAATVREFWQNLAGGVESIRFASPSELAAAGLDAERIANRNYITASSTISEPEYFDAAFFGFSPRDAEIIDPQHRVFLECAWEALEDAGCNPDEYAGAIGVFAGAGMNTYALNLFSRPDVFESAGAYQIMVGNDKDFLCSRVAYKLNLRGPAVGVQTACSTSLVAVQMAFESLLRGECDAALAGGVSIPAQQSPGYMYVPGMILSRDGHCRAFDASASGTVPGAGAGVVMLKRLEDAVADGDHIYAVIHGAAINNDGSAKVGYSAPSVEGQAAVIARSMQMAGFDAGSIGYVEAHGTGTEVGDPIEFAALSKVFAPAARKANSCALGALKTNIGHLDTAAGVAGLIKAALAIQHRQIPPTLHFEQPNPLIDLAAGPFFINTSLVTFDSRRPFRAGVSSFGIGGTNAHVSLEEAPQVGSDASSHAQVIVLSAKTAPALDRRIAQLSEYLEVNPSACLADLAFTLQTGRKAFAHRKVVVANHVDELRSALQISRSDGLHNTDLAAARVVFLFPGQGSQYVNMGRGLYETASVFRKAVDHSCELLKQYSELDLLPILYPEVGKEEASKRLLDQTSVTQPALFVVEYAMAQLWMDLGIVPGAMLGHSVGEYVAACLAGVFSLDDGLALVAGRGRLMQSMPPGTMLAVSLDEEDLDPLLSQDVSIAAINTAGQTVASGPLSAIDALEAALQKRNIGCRRLHTSHAFHSSMMEPIIESFVKRVAAVELKSPMLPFISNVTGTWITLAQAVDPAYWGLHLRSTVRFREGSSTLLEHGEQMFIEVGPGDTLTTLIRSQEPSSEALCMPSMRHPLTVTNDREFWLASVGRIWLRSMKIDWGQLHTGEKRRKLSLPTYPFERQRHYIEAGRPVERAAAALRKRADVGEWFYSPSWKRAVHPPVSAGSEGQEIWLVLADACEFSQGLVAALGEAATVIEVRTGSSFRSLSGNSYEINASQRDDYQELVRDLARRNLMPGHIVHALMATPFIDLTVDRSIDHGVYSALALIQEIEASRPNATMHFTVVCDRAYSVFGEEISTPAAGALNAFSKVIPHESTGVVTRIFDVDLTRELAQTINQLAQELRLPPFAETVAFRGKTRWLLTFEPAGFNASSGSAHLPGAIALQPGGTYVVTGGLGGVGLVLARHIAEKTRGTLVLTSRTLLPPAAEWPLLLEAPTTADELRQRIAGVQAIEASGGRIVLLEADAADHERMLLLLAAVAAEHGPVHGIVHAAGIAGGGMALTKSRNQLQQALAAKVQGTEWIRQLLGSPQLDFVLLCSSISAIVPAFGLSAYAAANAYLDGFAAKFDAPGATRVISVNWDTWREVGMAANAMVPAGLEQLRKDGLRHGIVAQEAEEIFDRLLEFPLSQVLISTRSLDRLVASVEQARQNAKAPGREAASGASKSEAKLLGDLTTDDELEGFIITVWQELLGNNEIGAKDNFFQLGGHSLLGTQVLSRIQQRFGISLSLRTIFEAATPEQLAQSIRLSIWAATSNAVLEPDLDHEEIEL